MFDRPLTISGEGQDLVLSGSVDEHSVAELRECLDTLVEAGLTVRVDLNDVDYLPSAGLGVLARAQSAARKRGHDVVLVAAEGTPAQRILHVTRLPHETDPGEPGLQAQA